MFASFAFEAATVRLEVMQQFYIDRKLHWTVTAADAAASGRAWPFGSPQYIVLNVAVSDGTPNSTTFPRNMTVGPISIWIGVTPF